MQLFNENYYEILYFGKKKKKKAHMSRYILGGNHQ